MDLVAAGLLVRDGRVFLCHRSPDRRWFPDVWDLPGGHIEEGETPTGALVRELREELGIEVAEPSTPEFFRLADENVSMAVWVIEDWSGTPSNCEPGEHDDMAWFAPEALDGLALADPAYPDLLARALKAAG
jgi:8-oxo-dGTP diphosphatase